MKRKTTAKQSIEGAWEAYFSSLKTYSYEEIKKDGWLTILEISERMGVSAPTANQRVKSNPKFEYKIIPLDMGDGRGIRETRVARFKTG